MHVGVDACCWLNRRGYGRHARSLFDAVLKLDTRNRYTFLVDSPEAYDLLPERAGRRLVKTGRTAVQSASFESRRSLADAWRMSRALADPSFDLLVFPTVYTYVPVLSRARKMVVIHDVIPETFPRLTTPHPLSRFWWRLKVLCGIGQCELVLTVSEFSRRGIRRCFGVDADRIRVVGEAADETFRRIPNPAPSERLRALGFDPERRSVVFLGGFSPHKNLPILIAAFAAIARRPGFEDVTLWLVGDTQGDSFLSEVGRLRNLVTSSGLDSRVVFSGFLPDEDLVILLNLASVLVLPSLMEGFGLPAIEAARCGCPVIATSASPIPEILGEGCLIVDPGNQRSLETALDRMLASEGVRARLGAAGWEAAGRLSWENAARQLLLNMEELSRR